MANKILTTLQFADTPDVNYQLTDSETSGKVAALSAEFISKITTNAPLSTISDGAILEKDGHYTMTLTADATISAAIGTEGYTGAAELFINPGIYTLHTSNNIIVTNSLTQNQMNYCTLNWIGTTCRLYVIDAFDA